MPLIFPGSSEQLPTHVLTPAPAEQPAEVIDKLAALSVDEPLPEVYAGDLVRLLVQSPYRLYLYWNHARDPFETLRRAFGAGKASSYRLAVRLVEVESGEETFFEAKRGRNHWFDTKPGRQYRASVGFFAAGRPFIRVLTSDAVRTPRTSVSHVSDQTPEFQVNAPEFARVLNEAGYASDALEVTLEAADASTHDEMTRELARALAGSDAPLPTDDALSEMRSLLAALAFGEPLERLLPALSPALAEWLEESTRRHEDTLSSRRLLDILRASLALELEFDARFDEQTEDAMRRAARFVWGASDVQMPKRAPRLLMPSMNEGLVSRLARWRQVNDER